MNWKKVSFFLFFTLTHMRDSTLRLLNVSRKNFSIQAVQQVFYSTAGPVPLSVYQRLKKLEDRILELEGLSPEYFQSTVSHLALNAIHDRHLIIITQCCCMGHSLEKQCM